MKTIVLSACYLIAATLANAQSPAFEWAKKMGGTSGAVWGNSVATDASGNVYTTGYFNGTVDFDPGPAVYYITADSLYDIFISKSDVSGNFVWAKSMGGTLNDKGLSIAVDASGNVYTTGVFRGTGDFDPGAGIVNLTSAGLDDIFISKLNSSGNFVWAKRIGGTTYDNGYSLTIDISGNVYTTGSFFGIVDFDPGAGTFNLSATSGSSEIFILKLDASGNFVWAKDLDGNNIDAGYSITTDGSGNVYTTGYFTTTVDMDPGPAIFNLVSVGAWDIFISKLNSSGSFVWAKQLGGTQNDYGYSIKVDGSGNVYTTGSFVGTADFDPGAGTFNLTADSSVYADIFISKLDVSGNFVWAKNMGGTYNDVGISIALDASANVYTTGYFNRKADFDPGAGTFNLISDIDEIFISKLNSSGNFVWAKQIEGSGNYGNSITIDASNNIYLTGFFWGEADFDPGAGTFSLFATSGPGYYLSKLNASGNFVWAKNLGANSQAAGRSVAVDPSGNVYTAGYFQGTTDFDPSAGTFYLASTGNDNSRDIFISKSDAAGNFVWAKNVGGTDNDDANSIAVDASGNSYIAGYFNGTADFDPGAGIVNLTANGINDIFILKLDASGNLVWVKHVGGISYNLGNSITLDASGNVYITGSFHDIVDFDPGPGIVNLTADSLNDIFILKLNASGNFVWAKQMGGTSDEVGNSIAVDASGNVYTTGNFYGTTDFNPGAGILNLTADSLADIFISKLDASGNFVWARRLGGTNYEVGNSISVDASGNVYTTGTFYGTVDFDPGAGVVNLTSAGSNDIFISKLNASGNFVWAKQVRGTLYDNGNSIKADSSGNVYVTGTFWGTADFDPGAGTDSLISAGEYDIFVLRLDASGNFVWAKNSGGVGQDYSSSIAIDAPGNIYTTGFFELTADFDPGAGTFYLTAGGYSDIFVQKMSQCASPSATITPGGSISFCSGGNIVLNANTGTGLTYQWKLNTANISGATNASYAATAAGSYSVVVTNSCGSATSAATTVTVNPLPSATISAGGPTTFCNGGSVTFNASVVANRTYQWKKGANLISGATLSSYTTTTGGNYRVIATNTVTGCSKTTTSAIVLTVNALPAATITPQGPTTFCAGGSVVLDANTGAGLTYKWKKGNGIIGSATNQNYIATTAGTYKVIVTNSNTCSKTSTGVTVTIPCKEGESILSKNSLDFIVYPNPNPGEFAIKFSNQPTAPIQIELTDEIGKAINRFETSDETVVIRESNLAKGIYCLTARNKDEVVIKKISVVK